ncbi:hypothetical protein GR217_22750 [Rhizobium leguminosarum]|uniref:Uncharacterized protein n=1 Tax=Rhizobium ruizarguesonis TaxID=2081791 RepID=A0AAE4YSP5_9HYPH|nr:hypothetical protein [Rhizobium ruizarguesonis]NEI50507.1 hypothetical protein [Rhizobium ruizarguesonis]
MDADFEVEAALAFHDDDAKATIAALLGDIFDYIEMSWHNALLPESLSRDSIVPEAIRSESKEWDLRFRWAASE